MITADPAAPLSDADLQRLESLLASERFGNRALPIDAVQGLFFAIASGPDEVPSSRWLPAVLGAEPADDESDALAETLALLTRFSEQCSRELASGDFALHLYAREDGTQDLETWCLGYLDGVDLAVPAWDEAGDPDEIDEILFPFVVLAGELSDDDRAQFGDSEWRDLVRSCELAIAEAIVEVREYWDVVCNPPVTVRREGAKVGRNDPCPCGSGRKFKHCCAAGGP